MRPASFESIARVCNYIRFLRKRPTPFFHQGGAPARYHQHADQTLLPAVKRRDAIQGGCQGRSASAAARKHEFTGKVCEVVYDCFGDFEGFELCVCCDETRVFKSRKRGIEEVVLRACRDRLTVILVVDPKDKTEICAIALRC